jgi:hypothetical protein
VELSSQVVGQQWSKSLKGLQDLGLIQSSKTLLSYSHASMENVLVYVSFKAKGLCFEQGRGQWWVLDEEDYIN